MKFVPNLKFVPNSKFVSNLKFIPIFVQNISIHIQNVFKQKKEKKAYLLGQIGSAHSETAPRRERIAPARGGA
jgi:hypothetical protein